MIPILLAVTAVYLLVMTSLVNANGFLYVTMFKVAPVLLAFLLGAFALALWQHWPIVGLGS